MIAIPTVIIRVYRRQDENVKQYNVLYGRGKCDFLNFTRSLSLFLFDLTAQRTLSNHENNHMHFYETHDSAKTGSGGVVTARCACCGRASGLNGTNGLKPVSEYFVLKQHSHYPGYSLRRIEHERDSSALDDDSGRTSTAGGRVAVTTCHCVYTIIIIFQNATAPR